jgi:UDP-hydrolysing UDP-N-acetyl-D-glucosamine 2-epimerase
MRTIAVVSGNRSELGLLRPVMRRVHRDRGLELKLLLCGWHFDRLHKTVDDIKMDGFPFEKIAGKKFGALSDNFSKRFEKHDIDVVLVVGDRKAALAAAYAAAESSLVIAHIHGGDKTISGHIDEAARHSITRFAHVHFAACASSAERLRKMGEQRFRIKNVGTPVIDAYLDVVKKKTGLKKILIKYGLDPGEKYILCLQHPTILEWEEAGVQMENTLAALHKTGLQTLVIYPNGDPGTNDMVKVIKLYEKEPWVRVRRSIHHDDFCHIFKNAAAVVGNSSAGIIEGSFFKVPVVNVGKRNRGREHGKNIIFTGHSVRAITGAVKKAMTPAFRREARRSPSIYGTGKSSEKIVKVLKSLRVDDRLLRKQITF